MTLMLLAVLMAVLARASGGGIVKLSKPWDRLPEIAFGAVFGITVFMFHGVLAGVLAWAWSWIWMETGHGTALAMGSDPKVAQGTRKQFLSPAVDAACRAFRQPLGGKFYCWVFFGIKGLLIGLPVAPVGLALAVLWPAAYATGEKIKRGDVKELASGGCAGLVIWVYLYGRMTWT